MRGLVGAISPNILALAVAVLTVLLRLLWIDRLGLAWDDDISTLAARGIAHTGMPTMPSGHVYWRAPLYHYLIAPLAAPGIDWLPRLAAVLFAGITAFLIVRWGSRWVGREAAFVGGCFYALSIVEIYVARQVRMYSLYELLAVVALLQLYRYWRDGESRSGWLAAGAVLLATGAHELAATLGVLFLPIALRHRRPRVWIFCLLAVGFFGAYPQIQRFIVVQTVGGMQGIAEPPPSAELMPVRHLFRTTIARDPFAFGFERLGRTPFLALLALLGLAGLGAGAAALRRAPLFQRAASAVAFATIGLLAGSYAVGLAAAGFALVWLHREDLLEPRVRSRVLWSLAVVGGGICLAWIAAALLSGYGPHDVLIGVLRRPGRLLAFFAWPPLIGLAGILGLAFALRGRGEGDEALGARFLVLVLAWSVLTRTLAGDRAELRYIIDLCPAWELLAGWGVVVLVRWVPSARARTAAAAVLAALALLLPGTGLRTSLAYMGRGPGEAVFAGPRLDTVVSDLRGACAWVRPRIQPGDRIVASDWLTTYCYLGRVDGWIRGREYGWQTFETDGKRRDWYLGAELLRDLPELEAFLAGGPAWIVTDAMYASADYALIDPEVRRWLVASTPVWVSADSTARVYRMEPATSTPGGSAR